MAPVDLAAIRVEGTWTCGEFAGDVEFRFDVARLRTEQFVEAQVIDSEPAARIRE